MPATSWTSNAIFTSPDIWTKCAEPRLLADPTRFQELADTLLDALLRNAKSEQVQILLDLMRSETTPQEIAASLARGEAWVECDPRPRALQSVDIEFALTHPALQSAPAARRLLIFDWNTGDETSPPPNVHRFSHYFRAPATKWWAKIPPPASYDVTVAVRVPFSNRTEAFGFATVATPRTDAINARRWEPMELASFGITTAIAVVTAFGTQYASSLPDEIRLASLPVSLHASPSGLTNFTPSTISPASAPIAPAPQPSGGNAPAPARPHEATADGQPLVAIVTVLACRRIQVARSHIGRNAPIRDIQDHVPRLGVATALLSSAWLLRHGRPRHRPGRRRCRSRPTRCGAASCPRRPERCA